MEPLLDLISLYLHVKTTAMIGTIKLQRNSLAGDLQVQLKILQELEEFAELADNMILRFNLDKQFEIVIQNRQTWEYSRPNLQDLVVRVYTEGSKADTGVGISIVSGRYGRFPCR